MSALFRADPLPAAAEEEERAPPRLAWRLHGALFFGAVAKIDPLVQAIEAAPMGVLVELDMHELFALDTTGLEGLEQILKAAGQRGGRLRVQQVQDQPRSLMERSGFTARLAEQDADATPPASGPSSAETPG
jgi:SulP family sulfate permease